MNASAAALRGASAAADVPRRCRGLTESVTARAVGFRLWSSSVPPARRQQGRVESRHVALRSAYRVMAECRRSATMGADVCGDDVVTRPLARSYSASGVVAYLRHSDSRGVSSPGTLRCAPRTGLWQSAVALRRCVRMSAVMRYNGSEAVVSLLPGSIRKLCDKCTLFSNRCAVAPRR